MKNIKKIVAMTLALVMVFALAGCGSEKNVFEGKWQVKTDMIDDMSDMFNLVIGEEYGSLKDYLTSFSYVTYYEFNADGTFKEYYDTEALSAEVEGSKQALVDYMTECFKNLFREILVEGGITDDLSTDEKLDAALKAAFDCSLDEAIEDSAGSDLGTFVDELLAEMFSEEVIKESESEGKYKYKDGKLYLSAGLNYECDPEVYYIYELGDKSITITSGVGIDEDESFSLPFTMNKVA